MSCSSVCTSVGVTGCSAVPVAEAWLEGWTRSWAVAEYCLAWVSATARLAATPSRAAQTTHHLRRRRTTRYERRVGLAPNSAVMRFPRLVPLVRCDERR